MVSVYFLCFAAQLIKAAAEDAFDAREFHSECIDKIFECADKRGKSTEIALWNSVDLAKFKWMSDLKLFYVDSRIETLPV